MGALRCGLCPVINVGGVCHVPTPFLCALPGREPGAVLVSALLVGCRPSSPPVMCARGAGITPGGVCVPAAGSRLSPQAVTSTVSAGVTSWAAVESNHHTTVGEPSWHFRCQPCPACR